MGAVTPTVTSRFLPLTCCFESLIVMRLHLAFGVGVRTLPCCPENITAAMPTGFRRQAHRRRHRCRRDDRTLYFLTLSQQDTEH